MKTQLVTPTAPKASREQALYGGNISTIRFIAAIAMVVITVLTIWFTQAGSHLTARAVLASGEFTSGMPLP